MKRLPRYRVKMLEKGAYPDTGNACLCEDVEKLEKYVSRLEVIVETLGKELEELIGIESQV